MFLKTILLIFVIYKINFINYDLYILCDIFYSFPIFVLKKYVINLQKNFSYAINLSCQRNIFFSQNEMDVDDNYFFHSQSKVFSYFMIL